MKRRRRDYFIGGGVKKVTSFALPISSESQKHLIRLKGLASFGRFCKFFRFKSPFSESSESGWSNDAVDVVVAVEKGAVSRFCENEVDKDGNLPTGRNHTLL